MPFPFGFRRRPPEEEDVFARELPGEFSMPEIREFSPEEAEEEDPAFLSSLMGQYGQDDEGMETPVFNRYLEEIQNAPQRADYQLGTGKKILAGLAGALTGFSSGAGAGAKVIQDITQGPFRRAQEDFKSRIEPLEKGVGFEKSFSETMRKRMNDQRGYGAKLAKVEGDYAKAKGQLEVAKQKANTADDLARIKQAELDLDVEYKRAKTEIDRMNAGSNRTRAGAAQTSANARMKNAEVYQKNQGSKPRNVRISEQISAEAVGAKEALNELLEQLPDIKAAGNAPSLDNSGNLVFPDDMSPATQGQFKKLFNDLKAKKAKERLGATY